MDSVYHNVFSTSPDHLFDLGTYRAGDAARSIRFLKPGVVDIHCNIHGRMRASVLVVPNSIYTRVGADGSFRLPGVPVGTRRLVAWARDTPPALSSVEVGARGADVRFVLEPAAPVPHNDKFGRPYDYGRQ